MKRYPRRGELFVTRKIAKGVAAIVAGTQETLSLGNLDSARDWGYAPEYVEAMWKLLQLDRPEDLVIGTGETHTVREFVDAAFGYAGLSTENHVKIDQSLMRPADVELLIADTARGREILGWEPKIKFDSLVKLMVDAEFEVLGLEPRGEGKAAVESAGLMWSA